MEQIRNSIANALELCLFSIKPSIDILPGLLVGATVVEVGSEATAWKPANKSYVSVLACVVYHRDMHDMAKASQGHFY